MINYLTDFDNLCIEIGMLPAVTDTTPEECIHDNDGIDMQ